MTVKTGIVTLRTDPALLRSETNLRLQQEALDRIGLDVAAARDDAKKYARFQGLCDSYHKQTQVVERAEEEYQRLVASHDAESRWSRRAAELRELLDAQYGDRGPQYDILVSRVVGAEIYAERLEASGRHVDAADWHRATRAVLEAVQALQRYTESQKTEIIRSEQQRAMVVVLELCERVIAPRAPELWANVVEKIAELMPEADIKAIA